MADLAEKMYELRDQMGLALADALVQRAARDSIGTVESLDHRFRMAGLPQSPEILQKLIALREEASRAVATNPRQSAPSTESRGPDNGTVPSPQSDQSSTSWTPARYGEIEFDDQPPLTPQIDQTLEVRHIDQTLAVRKIDQPAVVHQSPTKRPSIVQVEAAKLRLVTDRRLGKESPAWLQRVAKGLPPQSVKATV